MTKSSDVLLGFSSSFSSSGVLLGFAEVGNAGPENPGDLTSQSNVLGERIAGATMFDTHPTSSFVGTHPISRAWCMMRRVRFHRNPKTNKRFVDVSQN